jgi:hypothetical protein
LCIGEGRGGEDTHTQLRNILSELPAGNEKKYYIGAPPRFGKRKNKLRKKKENIRYFVFVQSKGFEMITDIELCSFSRILSVAIYKELLRLQKNSLVLIQLLAH